MVEPKQIRSTKDLNGVVKTLLELAIKSCKDKGVTPLVVETVRTQERTAKLDSLVSKSAHMAEYQKKNIGEWVLNLFFQKKNVTLFKTVRIYIV